MVEHEHTLRHGELIVLVIGDLYVSRIGQDTQRLKYVEQIIRDFIASSYAKMERMAQDTLHWPRVPAHSKGSDNCSAICIFISWNSPTNGNSSIWAISIMISWLLVQSKNNTMQTNSHHIASKHSNFLPIDRIVKH